MALRPIALKTNETKGKARPRLIPSKRRTQSKKRSDEWISVAEITDRYGGTHGKWLALIDRGRLVTKGPGGSARYLVRTDTLRAYLESVRDQTHRTRIREVERLVRSLEAARRLKSREGVVGKKSIATLPGTSVPVWRIEQARRAGSDDAALMAAFPQVTSASLASADEYAHRFPDEIDRCIREQGAVEPPPRDEADMWDLDEFDRDLRELSDQDAELLRRLAQ
jgi:uncharacterized protein (DUF433 family)